MSSDRLKSRNFKAGKEPLPTETTVKMRTKRVQENDDGKLANAKAAGAINRGLEVLHETEFEKNIEEIKKMDSQLDTLNKYLNKVETRAKEHNDKLQVELDKQQMQREKRKSSLQERMANSVAEDLDFQRQIDEMLSRCAQNRTSLAANSTA